MPGLFVGLLPKKPGPRRDHKLSEEVMQFVLEELSRDASSGAVELAQQVQTRFGLKVHPRSNILHNPWYAGAYAFGRRRQVKSIEDGKQVSKMVSIPERSQWQVLITEHHEGYISWEKYLANMEIIKHNANMKSPLVRGAVRQGQHRCPYRYLRLRCNPLRSSHRQRSS